MLQMRRRWEKKVKEHCWCTKHVEKEFINREISEILLPWSELAWLINLFWIGNICISLSCCSQCKWWNGLGLSRILKVYPTNVYNWVWRREFQNFWYMKTDQREHIWYKYCRLAQWSKIGDHVLGSGILASYWFWVNICNFNMFETDICFKHIKATYINSESITY